MYPFFLLEDKQFAMNIWQGAISHKYQACVPYGGYCGLLKEILPCGNHFAGFK